MLEAKSINSQVEHLIRLRDSETFNIFKFEDSLYKLLNEYGAKSIVPLMILFQDDFDFPEAMFSIVHGIEHTGGEKYEAEMMEGLHKILPKAPEWAITLVTRILNSPISAQSAVENLSKTKQEYKNSWKQVLLQVNEKIPDFIIKTTPLLKALA